MKHLCLKNKIGIACCAALFIAGSSSVFAAPEKDIATLVVLTDANEVAWDPDGKTTYGFIDVRMSAPDGQIISAKFPYGEAPYFPLSGDGLYSYELYQAPLGTIMSGDKQADSERTSGPTNHNGRTRSQVADRAPGQDNIKGGSVQSGTFRIVKGQLVDPTLPEEK